MWVVLVTRDKLQEAVKTLIPNLFLSFIHLCYVPHQICRSVLEYTVWSAYKSQSTIFNSLLSLYYSGASVHPSLAEPGQS